MRDRIQRCGYSTFFKTKYRYNFEGSGYTGLVFFCICCKKSSKVAEIDEFERRVAEMLRLLQKGDDKHSLMQL